MDMLPLNVYDRQKWIEELQERIDKIRGKELGFYLTIAEATDIMFVLKEADDSIQGYKESQLKGLELEHEILALKIKENERAIQCIKQLNKMLKPSEEKYSIPLTEDDIEPRKKFCD